MSFTDAYNIINKKILINKMSIDNLNHQINMSDYSIKIQNSIKKVCNKKIELINKLNGLLEKQLSKFSEEVQDECILLYQQINGLDEKNVEYKNALKEYNKYKEMMMHNTRNIEYLEKTIPEEKVVTNYNIKTVNTNEKCKN